MKAQTPYKDSADKDSKDAKPASSRPGSFTSKANIIKLSEEVPYSPSLIFDIGAEASFVPDCYPIPTSNTQTTVEDLLPDGHGLPVFTEGTLGQDICYKIPGLHEGLLGSSAVTDSLVTIFDNDLTIFQPTKAIAQVFQQFMNSNVSALFATCSRDTNNLFRLPLYLISNSNNKKKCCLTRYYTVSSSTLRDSVMFWHEATDHPSVDVMVVVVLVGSSLLLDYWWSYCRNTVGISGSIALTLTLFLFSSIIFNI